MKKIIGLSTLALAGVLAFTGCSVSEEDGKAWAEENGYVKVEEKTHLGEYEFEYIKVDKDYYYACPASGKIEYYEGSFQRAMDCSDMDITLLKITEDKLSFIDTAETDNAEEASYIINEKNEILYKADEGEYHFYAKYENDRLYINEEANEPLMVFKRK